jgi:hypothetical protein
MEKTAPPKLSKKLPEQLALPLAEPAAASPTGHRETHPRQAWTTLGPQGRASVKERWVRVMREAVRDARN